MHTIGDKKVMMRRAILFIRRWDWEGQIFAFSLIII